MKNAETKKDAQRVLHIETKCANIQSTNETRKSTQKEIKHTIITCTIKIEKKQTNSRPGGCKL